MEYVEQEDIEDRVERAFGQSSEDSVALVDGFIDALRTAGRDVEALRYQERGLFLRREVYGLDSPEVERACEDLTLMCNTIAMRLLSQDQHAEALTLLKKAELLTETKGVITDRDSRVRLRAVTLNNLGCLYKSRGKLHTALQYLDRALRMEANMAACDNPAGTHLNLCAILSQLGRHQAAADHARCALELLNFDAELQQQEQEDEAAAAAPETPGEEGADPEGGLGLGRSGSSKQLLDDNASAPGRISIRAIAFYNLAVEQEFLNLPDDALDSYGHAVAVAQQELGGQHPMTQGMQRSLQQAKASFQRRQRELAQRRAQEQAEKKKKARTVRAGAGLKERPQRSPRAPGGTKSPRAAASPRARPPMR